MTPEEIAVSEAEGWRFEHNQIYVRFSAGGWPVFASPTLAYKFVLRRAEEGSELHKRIIMGLPLTYNDSWIALERGYSVSVRSPERSAQLVALAELGDLVAMKVLRNHARQKLRGS